MRNRECDFVRLYVCQYVMSYNNAANGKKTRICVHCNNKDTSSMVMYSKCGFLSFFNEHRESETVAIETERETISTAFYSIHS